MPGESKQCDAETQLRIAKAFRKARRDMDLTGEALGAAVGCTSGTISGMEHCKHMPSLALFIRLCRVLGLSADTLLELRWGK